MRLLLERSVSTSVKVLKEQGTSLFGVVLPLVVLLFAATPWEIDPRNEPVEKELLRLEKSERSWDKVSYQRLIESVDPNLLVDGRPLFVRLLLEPERLGPQNKELLEKMIKRGANVNAAGWGCTPLMTVFTKEDHTFDEGDAAVAKLLLDSGADPNLLPKPKNRCQPRGDVSPLAIAVAASKWDLVKELLAHKARPKDREEAASLMAPLSWPEGSMGFDVYTQLVGVLKQSGAAEREFLPSGDTLLGEAIRAKNIREVRTLIGAGRNVNGRSRDGFLPLQIAIEGCKIERSSSSTDQVEQRSPLYSFYWSNWKKADLASQALNTTTAELVEVLLANGADPNLPLRLGGDDTMLTLAILKCSSDIPRILVAHKASTTEAAITAAAYDLKQFLEGKRKQ